MKYPGGRICHRRVPLCLHRQRRACGVFPCRQDLWHRVCTIVSSVCFCFDFSDWFTEMKNVRRILLWVTAGGLCSLSLVSIVGAFLQAEGAGAMVSSTPFIVVWCLLALLMLAGVVLFKRVRRSPALLAMHVGPLLILVGTMYGSPTGHRIWGALTGTPKTESGYLVVYEGKASNQLKDASLKNDVATLPFAVKLEDFRIENYEQDDGRWKLQVSVPARGVETIVDWEEGKERRIEEADLSLKVLQYIPSAQPAYEDGKDARLKVTTADGETFVPALEGEQVEVENPRATVRIEEVYSRLRVIGTGEERRVVDAQEGPANPALRVHVDPAEGESGEVFVIPRFQMHGNSVEGFSFDYVQPEPTGAVPADEKSPPAMEILLRRGDATMREWLIARPGSNHVPLMLRKLFPEVTAAAAQKGEHSSGGMLYLYRPRGHVKDYFSDLVVMEEGQPVAQKTIEVNDPLHYGGYHLYQSSYDEENGQYSILLAKSDSGLWMAYAGFLLLTVGVFAGCWVDPLISLIRNKKNKSE